MKVNGAISHPLVTTASISGGEGWKGLGAWNSGTSERSEKLVKVESDMLRQEDKPGLCPEQVRIVSYTVLQVVLGLVTLWPTWCGRKKLLLLLLSSQTGWPSK